MAKCIRKISNKGTETAEWIHGPKLRFRFFAALIFAFSLSFTPVGSPAFGQSPVEGSETSRENPKRIKRKSISRERTKVLRDDITTIPGHEAGTGIAVFLGLTGGPIWIDNTMPEFESNKDGLFLSGKAIGSFYTENWVTDVGLGWFYAEASNPEPAAGEIPPIGSNLEYIPAPARIALNAGLFEITPKFRLSENWQIGVQGSLFFSTNSDTSFNTVIDEQNELDKITPLVGAQIMFGVPKKEADWRAGIEYITDIKSDRRQISIAALTLQFGLPLVDPDTVIREKELLTERRQIERTEKRRIEKKVVVKEITKFVFEKQQILFSRNGYVLHPDSQSFLIELVGILNQNSTLWEELTVESHLGPDMTSEEAMILAESRADAVRASLISVGLEASRVKSKGFGNQVPIRKNSPSNRDERTVFSFSNVKDLRALSAAIAGIRAKFRVPETCTEQEGCE